MINIKDVEEVLALTEEIKNLEAKKKKITDTLKDEMIKIGQDVINHNGSKIQLVRQTRVSVKKGKKDDLLLFLKQKNLGSCIILNPDINKDSIETQINIGNITLQEIDQYMNITEVNSIRVTL